MIYEKKYFIVLTLTYRSGETRQVSGLVRTTNLSRLQFDLENFYKPSGSQVKNIFISSLVYLDDCCVLENESFDLLIYGVNSYE